MHGGVVEIAGLAMKKHFEAVALLLDSLDPLSETPENLALQRACINLEIPHLMNLGDLSHWAQYEAQQDLSVKTDKLVEGDEVVALVSHDERKVKMMEFLSQHADFLAFKHKEIVCTGTTGILVRELLRGTDFDDLKQALPPDRWDKIRQDKVLKKSWPERKEELEKFYVEWELRGQEGDDALLVHSVSPRRVKLTLYESGPAGGDIEIAHRIHQGSCDTVLFFHDPNTPHPHDVDIRLCVRTCQHADVGVTLRRDKVSAERWVRGCQAGPRYTSRPGTNGEPLANWPQRVLTLSEAENRVEGDNDRDVKRLANVAAGYIDELLYDRLWSRDAISRRVLILVAWGQVLYWIVNRLKDRLRSEQQPAPESRCFAREVSLARGRYGDALLVAPMIGMVGEVVRWNREAPVIARELAAAYGGHCLEAPGGSFFPNTGTPAGVERIRNAIEDHLADPEGYVVAITSVKNFPFPPGGSPRPPNSLVVPDSAIAEACGVFLSECGQEQELGDRESEDRIETVVRFQELRRIACSGRAVPREDRKGEVVVICGYSDARLTALSSMIRGGLVNTLITDSFTLDTIQCT
jgi:methylglyoxal synthase